MKLISTSLPFLSLRVTENAIRVTPSSGSVGGVSWNKSANLLFYFILFISNWKKERKSNVWTFEMSLSKAFNSFSYSCFASSLISPFTNWASWFLFSVFFNF